MCYATLLTVLSVVVVSNAGDDVSGKVVTNVIADILIDHNMVDNLISIWREKNGSISILVLILNFIINLFYVDKFCLNIMSYY